MASDGRKRHAEIAGAGFAGLMAATRLAQLGWSVRLHERSDELSAFGAGFWLWENGLRALEIIGAEQEATAQSRVMRDWRICEPDGEVLLRRPATPTDRLLLATRRAIHDAIVTQMQAVGVDVVTGSTAVAADPSGELELSDGRRLKADLVVAADGWRSRVRDSVHCVATVYHGDSFGIRLLIPHLESQPSDLAVEFWSGRWRILYNACTDEEDYIFLSAPVDSDRAQEIPVDQSLWLEQFPQLDDIIGSFGTAGRVDRLVDVRCRTWSHGRVAVVGDAAHAMRPNLGQAGNVAMVNSLTLAEEVSVVDDVPNALAAWQQRVRPLTNHVQRWSYWYDQVLQKWPESQLPQRSAMLKLAARSRHFMAAIDRGSHSVPWVRGAVLSERGNSTPRQIQPTDLQTKRATRQGAT